MTGSWSPNELPNLTNKNHTVTSPATDQYNCIAWAAGDDERRWWPDPLNIEYWPAGVQRGESLQDFIDAFSSLGYTPCDDGNLECGIEKIALFAKNSAAGPKPTHASVQLESGEWSSKLGGFEDILHTSVRDVECPAYGQVVAFMSRALS